MCPESVAVARRAQPGDRWMLTGVRWRVCCLGVVVVAVLSGCSLGGSTERPHASTSAVSTCLTAGENREQWHISAPQSPGGPEIWVPSLPGWEQKHAVDDPAFVLTLANKQLLGIVQVLTSDVTEDPVPSPRVALDDFMRGLQNRSKAIDGFDPRPARVCGLPAQQVTYTTQSPNGALTITALAVAVTNGAEMYLAALLVEGYRPRNLEFQSDAERFLRDWKIISPAATVE